MRRILLLWTLLATVLIGTGVVDSVHRLTHAELHRLSAAGVAEKKTACGSTAGSHGCPSHRHRSDPCGVATDAPSGTPGERAAPHDHPAGDDSHDDHECPICVTLASLAVTRMAILTDTTPIATLVGRAIVADALIAAPAPLKAIEARPPPTLSV